MQGEQMLSDELNQELLSTVQPPQTEWSPTGATGDKVETPLAPTTLPTRVKKIGEVVCSSEDASFRNRFLLVDDNPINLKILSSCMAKKPLKFSRGGQACTRVSLWIFLCQ